MAGTALSDYTVSHITEDTNLYLWLHDLTIFGCLWGVIINLSKELLIIRTTYFKTNKS